MKWEIFNCCTISCMNVWMFDYRQGALASVTNERSRSQGLKSIPVSAGPNTMDNIISWYSTTGLLGPERGKLGLGLRPGDHQNVGVWTTCGSLGMREKGSLGRG